MKTLNSDNESINILLIEDDEDDYVIVKEVLSKIENYRFELFWIQSVNMLTGNTLNKNFDCCLLDYRLGMMDGLAVLRELKENGFNAPIIMLTGQGSLDLDIDAMKFGAADYIEKNLLNSNLLERSIRYSIDRWRNFEQLKESEIKLRRLSIKVINAQEDERKHIAKELHDSIGSNLTAIKLMLESNKSRFGATASDSDFPFDKILSAVIGTIKETQRITKSLRPETLDRLGIIAAIKSLVRQFSDVNNQIQVNLEMDLTEDDISEPLKITIYRVMQEALNNIAKHSAADQVDIVFKNSVNGLTFSVKDNGKGFNISCLEMLNPEKADCMGLEGMRERIEISNGHFEINAEEGKGTYLKAWWPLYAEE